MNCVSKGKHPAVVWTRYQNEAASVDQIREWFGGAFASYGVGIITGAVSDIFVIDVDEGPGKIGGETINNLQFVNGDLPFTVQARTGGGGRHLIYRHPRDVWVTTGRNVLGEGVDIRGDGGFIVAAPSLHESGSFYLWDEAAHLRTTPIADAPAWLVELVTGEPPGDVGGGARRSPPGGTGEIVRDAWGKVVDGRERHMVGIICGVIATMARENGTLPTIETVIAEAWPSYERTTRARGESLETDGRGIGLMRQRTGHMLRRAASGKWNVSRERRDAPAPDPPPKQRMAIMHLEEMECLPPPEWLVHGLLPAKGLIVPYGPPKGGKTFIILSLALHIAAGMDWFGHPVLRGGVVYIAGEGIGGLGVRTRAMRSHYGIAVNIPFWIVPRAVNFTAPTAAADLVKLVKDTVADEPIAMVVVDTLARAMPGAEENSAKEVGLVIATCADVQDGLGCAVIPIHHQGKDETRGMRGTTAIKGAVDASFKITKAGNTVTMTNEDQKDAEPAPTMVFTMLKVAVGLTRSGLVPMLETGTREGVMDGMAGGAGMDGFERGAERPLSRQSMMLLQVIQNLMAGPESAILPPLSGMPSGDVRGINFELMRQAFYEKMPGEPQATKRVAFNRAKETLIIRHRIGVRDPWVWLV